MEFMGLQAVFGRCCNGNIPDAPPDEFGAVFLLSVLASAWAADDAALAEGAVEGVPVDSGGGSGFSSIRTMYW